MEKYPKKLLAVLLAITLGPATVLGWVGWRMLSQERSLQRQRLEERLREAAARIAAAEPRGSVSLRLTEAPVSRADFHIAEHLEYQAGQLQAAAALYRAAGDNPEALVRLARVSRRLGRTAEAMDAYARLESLGEAPVDGRPAGYVGIEGRCTLLAGLHRQDQLRQCGSSLRSALSSGRWPIAQPGWEFLWRQAQDWDPADPRQFESVLKASAWLWEQRATSPRGRRFLLVDSTPVWIEWQTRGTIIEAEVACPSDIETALSAVAGELRWSLVGDDGRLVLGRPITAEAPHAARFPAITHLPWTVYASTGAAETEPVVAFRVFGALFGLTLVVIVTGVFFIIRAAARELAVSRLQSDFVAAVSHEFRTPLSSLRQIAEMLAAGRVPDGEARERSYGILVRQTQHLHRLVESLLDFGRLEAGVTRYSFEVLDVTQLVRGCVAVFTEQHGPEWQIELDISETVESVRADREAIQRSISNLLDNAVKYSGGSRRIGVSVSQTGAMVAIRVRDEGIGIPLEEQGRIFQKFVRGRESKERGIRGTGLGLAMVRHIIEAHGGFVNVESAPGAGSTFSLMIPRERA